MKTLEDIKKEYGHNNFFYTPKNAKDLQDKIMVYSPAERTVAVTVAMMVQNFYAVEIAKILTEGKNNE
jgi:hypothetical protein